jgi:iron complex transport system ATP-binding protein
MKAGPVISTRNLTVGYKKGNGFRPILRNINLDISSNELVCLAGANGIGKSTLLKTLAGLLPVIEGDIFLNDIPLKNYRRQEIARILSIVLTGRIPTANLTSREVIVLGRYPFTNWMGTLSADDITSVDEAIQLTGTQGLQSRKIFELSDGEFQKVLIARALAQDSKIILLDEPTAHLDLENKISILQLLRDLSSNNSRAILITSHELELAFQVSDRIVLLKDGAYFESGTPEDLILKGSIGKFINGEVANFDPESGKFTPVNKPGKYTVMVKGSGIPFKWTKNGLERNGFNLSDTGFMASVEVKMAENELFWMIETPRQNQIVNSFGEVITALQKIVRNA